MKTITTFVTFLFPSFLCLAQFTNCKVADVDTRLPLYYATVYYGKQPTVTFSDSLGNFFVQSEILEQADSVRIEFIGYESLIITSKSIIEGKEFFLKKKNFILQDAVVKNCSEYKEKEIDYRYAKMKAHFTAFAQSISYLGYYNNRENITGYVSQIKFHVQNVPFIHQNLLIPLRLRWYKWNGEALMPGQELTDTSLLIYAYKKGWNTILIPDKTIYFGEDGIVMGIEFLYPSSLQKQAALITDFKKRNAYLNQFALHIGMVNDKTKSEGFTKLKDTIRRFCFTDLIFIKPALNLTIKVCTK